MWPRVFRFGTWIAAALGGLTALVALYYFVIAGIGFSQGESNAGGRTAGVAVVVLSLALLLATPLAIRLAIRRWSRVVAACVLAAVVVFGTFIVGLALIVVNAY